jgi:4-amino-4-deoxy-L-arabinose transferase-like glycosyltransferase
MGRIRSNLLTSLRPEWVLLILIIVAAALRFWQLDILPPGLFFDEAYNGLDANRVLTGASRPIFFAGNNGREPLFIYLQALSVALFGPTPLALRMTSAVVGIATVPVMYFAARAILPVDDNSSVRPSIDARLAPWLALIAAAGVAVSYWHVSLSRVGFRTILLVPVSALAIAFFWRAWTQRRWRDYLWSGVWFGVAFYTYTAARALPFVVLFFLLIELIVNLASGKFNDATVRMLWKQRLKGLLLMGSVAGLIVLPLLWVIFQDPMLFSVRTGDVSIFSVSQQEMAGTPIERLLTNVVAAARNFYDQGDLNQRHNLPGRPVNDPWLAILFTLGWVSAVWRIRLARNRFLLIWLGVMLMPTLLSTEAPHALRSTGALPAVAMFYALGGEAIYIAWSHLRKRKSGQPPQPAHAESDELHMAAPNAWKALLVLVLFMIVLISGGSTYADYFHRWAISPTLGYSFETDLQLAAQEAVAALADGQSGHAVLLSGNLFSQPQLRFALGQPVSMESSRYDLLSSSETQAPTRFLFDENFDPRRPLAMLWRDGALVKAAWTAPLVVPVDETIRQEEDSYVLAKPIMWPNHQLGWPVVFTGILPDQAQFCSHVAPNPMPIDFTHGLSLQGYAIDVDRTPVGSTADQLRLTLYWQPQLTTSGAYALPEEQTTLHDVGIAVHLMSNGSVLQMQDGPIVTDSIRDRSYVGGRVIEDARTFWLPSVASLDDAYFQIWLFDVDSGQPLADAGPIAIPLGEREHAQLPDVQTCLELAEQWPFPGRAWAGGPVFAAQWAAQALPTSAHEEPYWLPMPEISVQSVDTVPAARLTEEPLPKSVQLERYRSSVSGVRYPVDVRFANGMRLVAYDVWPDFVDPKSNERKVRLSLFWQGDAPSLATTTANEEVTWWNVGDFDIFAHLTDGNAVWQTANRRFADTPLLDRGGIVESVHDFVIPQDMSADKAYFEAGLYYYTGPDSSTTTGKRLPIVDQPAWATGNMVTLGGVTIGEQPRPDVEPSLPVQATFQDYIELSNLQVRTDADGSQIEVGLELRALDRPGNDYTAFVHLIDGEQSIVAQYDQPPGGGDNPTHLWAPNEAVRASFPLQLPPGVKPDDLTLRIGLYHSGTGDRLPLLSLANGQFRTPDRTYLLIPLTAVP